MKRPGLTISLKDPEIAVEWKDLFFGLGEAAISTALAVPTAGISLAGLAKGAMDALKAIRVSETPESRAFALIVLSVALAADRVIAQNENVSSQKKRSAKSIFEAIKRSVNEEIFTVDEGIFINPSSNDLYRYVREDCASIIANLLPNPTMMVDECAAKLDSAFNHSVFYVLHSRRDYFLPVEDALSNPGFLAAKLEFDWARYRASLIERFNVAPVFGQKEYSVALSQVYVALGGRWRQREPLTGYVISHNLEDQLEAWSKNGDPDDAIRLVFGGPGSGKSSLAKSLAAKLAAQPDVRPILIELQHTNALGDLRQAIEQRLVHEGEWFHSDPLAQKDDNRPFVLIFDGLDELVVPGTAAASRVADGFVVALKALMRALNVQGVIRARSIVTGRSAIMNSFAKAYDVRPEAAIEVLGFLYFDFEDGESKSFDRRADWWAKFSRAYGHPSDLPEALSHDKLNDITNEPLLCFLMAMSGYMTSNWSEAAENTNRIYAKLIGEIWERRWGQGEHATSGRVGPSLKLKSKDDFNLLMEALALAAWWGGENRVATKQMFDRALDVTRAHDIWSSFKEDDGDEMQNLALMFYMRKSEEDGQGVEFTHKTFSEYLVARFMMRFAHQKMSKLLSNRDIDLFEAATRWCSFAIQSRCDGGVIRFLRNEARLLDESDLHLVHKMMTDLISYAHHNGLPVQKLNNSNFKSLVDNDIKGKANALAVLSSVTLSLRDIGQEARVSINWGEDRTAPARFLGSLVDYRGAANAEDLKFPNFDFSSQNNSFCTCLFCCGSDFSGANFDGSMLFKSFLAGCDFSYSSFVECSMDVSALQNCDFIGANLAGARLVNSNLTNARLSGAILSDTNLSGCFIDRAVMDYGWWDAVDVATFINPPVGKPRIVVDGGVILDEDDIGYPDFIEIFGNKQEEANKARDEDIPF